MSHTHTPTIAAKTTALTAHGSDRDKPTEAHRTQPTERSGFVRFLYENGLTLVLMALFLMTLVGQIVTGHREHNKDQLAHEQMPLSLGSYLASGHFWEATAENWESEFLQMSMFVLLTVCLRQKGSPESKALEGEEEVDQDPNEKRDDPRAPWPVRKGGVAMWLYSHSLSIAFLLLFLVSIALHAIGGAKEYSQEQMEHGEPPVGMLEFAATSEFWFQSFQNWQSEFLSLAAMVYLAVYLREKGSAESKPVGAAHEDQE